MEVKSWNCPFSQSIKKHTDFNKSCDQDGIRKRIIVIHWMFHLSAIVKKNFWIGSYKNKRWNFPFSFFQV